MLGVGFMQAECELAGRFVHAWASMARYGRPLTSAVHGDWPEWRLADAHTKILDTNDLTSVHLAESPACQIFNSHQTLKEEDPSLPSWNLRTDIATH